MENNSSSFKRIKIESSDDLIKIIITPQLKIISTLIMLIFFLNWSVSGILIFTHLYVKNITIINNDYLFMWFFAWLIGELFFIYSLLWRFGGKEVLLKTKSGLQYSMDIAGFNTITNYELNKINNITVLPLKHDMYRFAGVEFLSPYRNVKFNYNGANKDFGINLSLEEATYIMNNLEIKKNQD